MKPSVTTLSPREAIKAISPGHVASVSFRFEALGGGVAFVRTAKVHAKAALRTLMPGARVHLTRLGSDGTVLISGPIPKRDDDGDLP